MNQLTIRDIHNSYEQLANQTIEIYGFVKQNRFNGKIGFISLNDGTNFLPIQVVYKNETLSNIDAVSACNLSTSILVKGKLIVTPTAKQPFEIQADTIQILKSPVESYPLQNKEQSFEFLREHADLRPRTNLFNAVMRIRSELAYALHNFFHEKNFVWTATPLITANDGEGAGETFFVTTNDKNAFFGQQVNLTVTGQLHGEAYAQAYKNIYTFGPTFRAEKSHTARHAAEFWMIEPEMAFCDLNQLMLFEEEMMKYVVNHFAKTCVDEIAYLESKIDPTIKTRIHDVLNKQFAKLEYSKAIKLLNEAVKKGIKFEDSNIHFGMDLGSEHERYICEQVIQGPVFLYNYPKDIKAFYMKQNDDNVTVAATDLLVPGIGELMGGSQREADYDKLLNRCQELKMDIEPLNWYLDLRRYGYYMSSGFGLGFERLVMYLTGIQNIRDVIPFPRTHGAINF